MPLHPLLVSMVITAPLLSQDFLVPPAVPYVRVHGEATVSAQPDRAQIDIGVITQAPSSKAATDLNARQSNALIDQLKAVIPAANIKTVNFSVNPNYRYPKDGGTPEVLGYSADNTVRLQVDDIAQIQKVIDSATKAGASNVNRLTFTLRDEAHARAEALGQAAAQARSGAEALAGSLQLQLGRVLRVEEGQPVIVSPARQVELSMAKGSSTSMTPVEAGSIDIHASVNLTFEVKGSKNP